MSGGRRHISKLKRNCVHNFPGGQNKTRLSQAAGKRAKSPVNFSREYKTTRILSGMIFFSSSIICQAYHSTPVFCAWFAREASIPIIICAKLRKIRNYEIDFIVFVVSYCSYV